MSHISELIEVRVEESLDEELLGKLQRQLREALELHPHILCVDLAGCPSVHDHCWPLLRAARLEARAQGTTLTVRVERP